MLVVLYYTRKLGMCDVGGGGGGSDNKQEANALVTARDEGLGSDCLTKKRAL
jgi:hypothetical protein